jgi:hypothetical protein
MQEQKSAERIFGWRSTKGHFMGRVPRIHHESKVNRPETKGLWKICVQCGMDSDADDHHRNPR